MLIVLASAFFFRRAIPSSSASGRRPPCWVAPCWSSPQGRCCPASKTGSAPLRAAHHSAAAHRARSAPSRCRHRGTPAGPAGVPGGRADVADLGRIVPGSHSPPMRGSDRSTPPARPTGELDDPDDVSELESPSVRRRSRRGRSRSGSTTGERTRRMTSARPSSDLAGCASPKHTRIANGSLRSHSNIANWRSPRMGRPKGPNFPNSPNAAMRTAG